MSFGEAGLNPRGVILLPPNNLYGSRANTRGLTVADESGGARNCRIAETAGFNRRGMKAKQADLVLPCFNPEAVFRRRGLPMIRVNRHPTCLVESVFVNVGGLRQNAKAPLPNVCRERRCGHSTRSARKSCAWERTVRGWHSLAPLRGVPPMKTGRLERCPQIFSVEAAENAG